MVRRKRKKKLKLDARIVPGVVIVVILVIAILISKPEIIKSQALAAEVNGEQIILKDIEKQYENMPEELKEYVTKEMVLQSEIDTILLKQEAEARGMILTDQDFNQLLDQALEQAGLSKEELENQLKLQGKTLDDIKAQFVIKSLLDKVVVGSDGQQIAIQKFVEELKSNSDIIVYMK